MDNIKKLLNLGGYSCVIVNDCQTRTFRQRGVADLYDLLENEPNFLHGALVADKVIGKAAASLMVLGRVSKVFTNVISRPALDVFNAAGISVDYDTLVPNIINRDKTGWCPLEKLCIDHQSPMDSYPVIRRFISRMRSAAAISVVVLSVFFGGYGEMQASVIEGDSETETLLSVDHNTRHVRFNEVVVTGTRSTTDVLHLPMSVSVIDRAVLEQRQEASVLPSLNEYVPGFFSTSRGVLGYGVSTGSSGGMTMRGIGGSPTSGMLVLIDGHPQYMGLMGHPLADAYQTMIADRVEVVRGPASVLYGSNAMGGVVNIVTRKNSEQGSKSNVRVGYGSYNTLTTEVSNFVNKGKFNTVITASYNRSDNHRENMDFEQYGGYAKVGYELNDNWSTFADVNATRFNASNPGSVSSAVIDNDSEIFRGITSCSLENNYRNTSGAVKLFYNWGRHKINDGYAPGALPLDYRFNSKDNMFGVTWYQSVSLFEGNRLTLGADYQRFGGEAWNRYVTDGHESAITDKTVDDMAGYVDFRQTIFNFLTFDAGMRIDNHSVTGTEYIPQLGISARINNTSAIKATVGKGFRNPTIREMYMFPPQNPDLLPERVWNYELSFSQPLFNNSFHYGISLFYIKGDNLIQTVRTDGRPLNVNIGEVENYGAEFDFNCRITGKWTVSGNYSRLDMKNPVVAAPEHKLYAGLDYCGSRLRLSAGVQYIDGLYTSVSAGKEQKESFTLINVRGSYKLNSYIDIFAKCENLLGERYEINAGYPMPKATFTGGFSINI